MKNMYAKHHLKGKKQDFFWRLDTPDRLERGEDPIRSALARSSAFPTAGEWTAL